MSSAQAEYNAASTAILALDHLRQVVQEIIHGDPDLPLTIPLYCDNTSAITIAHNARDTTATRHIARRIHRVRQAQELNEISMEKILGEENPADVGTKNLPLRVLAHLVPLMHHDVKP